MIKATRKFESLLKRRFFQTLVFPVNLGDGNARNVVKRFIVGKVIEGDCLVNLDKFQEGAECFAQAAKIAGDNPAYTPVFLMKEATVYHELKDYKKEAALYKRVLDEYPSYAAQLNLDIEKYVKRAEIAAGEE